MSAVFVTGTDTGCGKTVVSLALIAALCRRGLSVAGFKPVAAGAELCDGKLQNDDALALQAASSSALSYPEVNPFCYAAPISPHIAAAADHRPIAVETIADRLSGLRDAHDWVVVEGAGGWRVPLGPALDIEALVLRLELPVLLVVGLRLGCLNHAQLTDQAIRASGARLLGWVGSRVDPAMTCVDENLDTLQGRLGAPCLGVLPFEKGLDTTSLCDALDLDGLQKRLQNTF